jgi:hypothetical protein
MENNIKKSMRKLLKGFSIWTKFLKDTAGIDVTIGAGLIAHTGDIRRWPNLYKLYKAWGLDVQEDGCAPKKKRGQLAHWNHAARAMLLGVFGGVIIKLNGGSYTRKDGKIVNRTASPYRLIYDEEKQKQLDNGLTKLHAHNRAKRKAVKLFVKQYYFEYKRLSLESTETQQSCAQPETLCVV